MNNKILISGVVIVIIIIAGIFFITQRSSEKTSSETIAQPTPVVSEQTEEATPNAKVDEKDGSMTEGSVKEFTVSGSPFKMVPNTLKVKKGDTVKITFKNTQGIHNFLLDEFDIETKQLQAGQEEVVEFLADKAGTFDFYCSVGNHRAQGMEGTLIVE